jgi:acetylornithine deacetylase
LQQAVNPIELGTVALQEILKRFYADFPTHPEEAKYNYVVSSSMKPTQVQSS